LIGLPSYLVIRDRCGSLLAFARGDVAWRLNPYPSGYRTAFASSDLLARNPMGSPHGSPSLFGEGYGLTTFRIDAKGGLGPASPPVVTMSTTGMVQVPVPDHLPFGPSLSASLACYNWRRLSAISIWWPCHPTLAP